MQRLYENYKLLTYPRTDSIDISSDILPTIPDRLRGYQWENIEHMQISY